MIIGLITYVLGKPLVREVESAETPLAQPKGGAPSEAEAESIPSILGRLVTHIPAILGVLSIGLIIAGNVLYFLSRREAAR